VSLRVDDDERAISQAAAFLDDPQGIRAVLDAIDRLADDPRPAGSFPYGSLDRSVRKSARDCSRTLGEDHAGAWLRDRHGLLRARRASALMEAMNSAPVPRDRSLG
jgi:hypothetical protein